MSHSVEFHPDLGVVETVYAGALSRAELETAVKETIDVGREHNAFRYLADCRTLEGGHSLVDLYNMASLVEASGINLDGLREAVLLPDSAGAVDNVSFWESTSFNRGLNVKLFKDRDEALNWLCEARAE